MHPFARNAFGNLGCVLLDVMLGLDMHEAVSDAVDSLSAIREPIFY